MYSQFDHPGYWSKAPKIIAISLYLLLTTYFILSVESYIQFLRRRSALTNDILIAARQAGKYFNKIVTTYKYEGRLGWYVTLINEGGRNKTMLGKLKFKIEKCTHTFS